MNHFAPRHSSLLPSPPSIDSRCTFVSLLTSLSNVSLSHVKEGNSAQIVSESEIKPRSSGYLIEKETGKETRKGTNWQVARQTNVTNKLHSSQMHLKCGFV